MGIVTIFFIMPLAGWISDGLVGGITWVLGVGGGFAGFVLGTLFLPMVMFYSSPNIDTDPFIID